jgi:hypothetical protein
MSDDDGSIQQMTRGGCLGGLAACVASAALTLWLAWIAWQAIKDQSPYVLLGVAAILVAWPAWHVLARQHWRERDDDIGLRVSEAWLRQNGRPRP